MDAVLPKMHDPTRHSAAGVDRVEVYLVEFLPIAKYACQLATNAASYVLFFRLTCARLYRGSKAIRSISLVELFVVLLLPRRAKTGRSLRGGLFSSVLNLSNGSGP